MWVVKPKKEGGGLVGKKGQKEKGKTIKADRRAISLLTNDDEIWLIKWLVQ